MKDIFQSAALVTLLAWGNAAPALAQENLPGAQLEGLLAIAKANNRSAKPRLCCRPSPARGQHQPGVV
jgi:hypothetical protein